jgi:hypothetical protein
LAVAVNCRVLLVVSDGGFAVLASPMPTVGPAGVRVTEVRPVTVRVPLPVIEAEVATIGTVPAATAVARPAVAPEVPTVATDPVPALQATVSVMF